MADKPKPIPPRRGEVFSQKGAPTLRMINWMEGITSSSDETIEQVETNRLNIILLAALIADLEVRIAALEALVPVPVLTAVNYQTADGISEIITCNNTSSIDITMPTNPTSQQLVSIKRVGGVVNLIGNGRLIDGMATVKMTRIYTNLPLIYTLSTDTWDIQ